MSFQKLISQNVMGTPAMPYKRVVHDLRVVKGKDPTVVALQEFKWKWYWAGILRVFGLSWGKFPSMFLGPRSSQPILWHRSTLRKIRSDRVRVHVASEWTQERFLNCVLFEIKATGYRFWVTNTHLVPNPDPGTLRYAIWRRGMRIIRNRVSDLLETGHPMICVGDYNTRSEVFGQEFHGWPVRYNGLTETIDKVISIDNSFARIMEEFVNDVPDDELWTDHPGRMLGFRVVGRHES